MIININKPIFFIGVPRSGTTIIFEAFSMHYDLAWFSNLLELFPNHLFFSFFSRLTSINFLSGSKKQLIKQSKLRNVLPHPAECYDIWKSCCTEKFLFDFLFNQKAFPDEKQKITSTIAKVMKYHGKKRFAAKLTGPSRITYLSSIFPDALFVHIIRDGRAVVNSLIKTKFWHNQNGLIKPWWNNGLTKSDFSIYHDYNESPLALAALQWRRIIQIAQQEASKIFSNNYLEIKYEDFIQHPFEQMENLFNFSNLSKSRKVLNYISKKSHFNNQNFKFHMSFNSYEIEMLNDIIGDTLKQYGYLS